ncbi:unnamed protein product [Nesidiocoris tenuis]|uniref:Serine-threonine/tyrosine-protein kinase catalytic domain-containing protein n=1 Tax=Nesidiocoris tenuis TaxID=355587 RepID=A0A6H5GVN8_9HEMI|nr:unnamed protein product [Nesidiocoris tenuis]
MADLTLHTKIATTPSGETWRGRWQKNDIIAKVLNVGEVTARISRDFNEEFPKLRYARCRTFELFIVMISRLNRGFLVFRIFSHPNVLPVIGCCNTPPNLLVINQHMPWGSLYTLLHEGAGVVVDSAQALRFAGDVARGMAFLHSLERIIPQYHLNSRHVMVRVAMDTPPRNQFFWEICLRFWHWCRGNCFCRRCCHGSHCFGSSKTSDRSKLGSVRHVEFRYSPVGIGDSRGSLRRILGHRSRHEGGDEFLCTSTNSLYTGRIGNLDFVPDRPGRLEGDDSPRHFAPSFQTGTHLYERGCRQAADFRHGASHIGQNEPINHRSVKAKPQPIDESFPETTFDNNNNNNNKNSNNKNICRSTTNNNNKSNKNNYNNKNSSRNSNNHNSSSNHNNKNNNPKNNYNSKHNNNNNNKNNNNQNSNITLHGSSYNPVNCTNNNRWRTWLLASDNKYKEYNKN